MNFSEELLRTLAEDPVLILNRGYRAEERIASRRGRIRHWKEIAESITANPENASGGGGLPSKKVENCVCKIMELEEQICDEIAELSALEREAAEIIEEFVEDPTYKAVLEHRYIEQKRWEETAVIMSYTLNWVIVLHRRALRMLKANALERLPEEIRKEIMEKQEKKMV